MKIKTADKLLRVGYISFIIGIAICIIQVILSFTDIYFTIILFAISVPLTVFGFASIAITDKVYEKERNRVDEDFRIRLGLLLFVLRRQNELNTELFELLNSEIEEDEKMNQDIVK